MANWLRDRPDAVLSKYKEPVFFTDFADVPWQGPGTERLVHNMAKTEDAYMQSFGECPPDGWAIDASTDYLWCAASADMIKAWSARYEVKVATILRDPIERAISEYRHTIRDSFQVGSLMKSLEREEARYAEHYHPLFYHTRRSFYYDQVNRYRALFGDNFLLLGYHELRQPEDLRRKLETFLGLPEIAAPPPEKANVGGDYRSRLLAGVMRNKGLVDAARRVVPKSLRKPIRETAARLNKSDKKFQPTAKELDYLKAVLADDIAKCCADPFFPTQGWTYQF